MRAEVQACIVPGSTSWVELPALPGATRWTVGTDCASAKLWALTSA
jgi:hypothetical protein